MPESPHQMSGEPWQVARNGHDQLRTKRHPTQWTYRSGATPEIPEKLNQMHWAHYHDGETCPLGAMERTTRPLDATVHLNISADEHLPAGAENPWTTWKALNRLRTQVGRSRANMLKWGFSKEHETCDCGIRQTMGHIMVDTAYSPQYQGGGKISRRS